MTNLSCIARITLLLWLIQFFLLYALSDVALGQEITGSTKVSSNLRIVMDEMKARGITKQNAQALHAEALSNPLVRINNNADIHTYIHVYTLGTQKWLCLIPMG